MGARKLRATGPEVASGKRRQDENFPVGSLLIDRRLRPHVHAYYGFARAIDDIADNTVLSADDKLARLDAMEAALLGRPAGDAAIEAAHPAELAHALRLRASLALTGVPAATATDLIVAFRQDAVQPRYQSWDQLAWYCRYSANPVGRYLLALHGEGEASGDSEARGDSAARMAASDALCTALQVLNHLQDCADDLATLDRCYIPLPWLAEAGLDETVLRGRIAPAALRRVLDRLLDEVDALNRTAARLPGLVADRRMRLEAAVIVRLSHRLAARLRREDPLAGRVKLHRVDVARSLLGAARAWTR
ncbi:squalene/phytoene synthase family protein [Lichenicoccus sp.]|uniref:squalene/phytoene synthase family protein n=1 Tax=Lichenicoccus sp. TaxID=2781899 RepID=UPI003D0B7C79